MDKRQNAKMEADIKRQQAEAKAEAEAEQRRANNAGKTRKEILEEEILEQQLENLKHQQYAMESSNKLTEQKSNLMNLIWFILIMFILFGAGIFGVCNRY